MIGAIIGDIVGSRFEFNNHRSTEFGFFHPDCEFTDDTVMTVAVADAIMSGRRFGEVMHEYGRQYPNRGYGARFFNWLLSENPKPYNSFGNGSAMRVSPCALLSKGNRELALTWATASAVCTHNHPEGVKGAMAITDCILMAMEQRPKEEINDPNIDYLTAGLPNLEVHIENLKQFTSHLIVALNKFATESTIGIQFTNIMCHIIF